MGLNYSIAMLKNPQNQDESAKAYAKSQITGELSLKELSRRVAAQTTASRADVTAVIIATVENMIDGLRAGEQVDFGDLGKFRLQITSRGAETAEKFTATNITGVNIQFIPGEDLKTIFSGLEFSLVPTRAATRLLLKAQKAGQTTVDFSKTPSSDGNSGSKPDDGGNTGGGGLDENPLG
ncbi:HU family DNA-binding protein [Bacteroides sp. BFG-257]|uniref:HU family DNA-binding protein n=1 Tax=Bacteroides TaxID=816 RepID=UPI001CCF96AB|nr:MULTISPECIES: HU family DNA-binding protein [Bacteroides]UBD69241.1 HU family DNA-binding protein [Bacteroides cellulosilyticus]UVO97895.1 HU family DNA-binding protein [Bacteroides sp. BFG-257]